jgi:YD repeat-containing protein
MSLEMDQNGTNYIWVNTTRAIGDGAFHLITFVRQGTTVSAYTDGAFDASGSAAGVTDMVNAVDLVAGKSACTGNDGTGWLNGALDDIKLYTRALTASEIASYYQSTPAGPLPANPGLMDWWPADGNALDAMGPYNGAMSNIAFTSGQSGQAFSYNGTNSSIDFGANAGTFRTGDFTIQFWIKDTSSSPQGILGKRPVCGHGYFWDIRGSSSGMHLEMDQNGTNYFTVSTVKTIGNGAFHLITFVRRGTVVSAYTDGTFDASSSASGVTDMDNAVDLVAGKSACTGSDGTGWLTGQLDDIRLYNRALSANEIKTYALVTAPGTTTSPVGGGLIRWHPHYQVRFSHELTAQVDLSDGHLDLTASTMHLPGLGPDLDLQQTYDSVLGQAGITSTQGQGWSSSLTLSMGGTLTGTVLYTDTTGATYALTYTGSPGDPGPYTSYTVPAGEPWQLTASTTGYTLTNILNGSQRTFDAQGRYLADTDSYGNANGVGGEGSGLPSAWVNSGDRQLTLAWQYGLLSEVQSPLWVSQGSAASASEHVTYGYSGTQLITLTQATGTNMPLQAVFGYSGTQLVTITTPAHASWSIQYDPYGRVSTITNPISGTSNQAGYTPGYAIQFYYRAGQTQVVEGANTKMPRLTSYQLDALGETTVITDAIRNASTFVYDADHDISSTVDANGHITSYRYQYVGGPGSGEIASTGLITETDQPAVDGSGPVVNRYTYDANNDLVKTVSPNGGLTYYSYDGHHTISTTAQQIDDSSWRGTINVISPTTGLLMAQTDGRGTTVTPGLTPTVGRNAVADAFTRTWLYNEQGDLVQASTPPLTTTAGANIAATTTYTPDLDGNVVSSRAPSGAVTSYVYDHLGRLVQTTQPTVTLFDGSQQAPVSTVAYDGDGRVSQTTDPAGDVTQYSYDPLGRLVALVNPLGATTRYTYTATTLSAAQDPAGNPASYGYDPAGRLISATDATSATTRYGYDAVGNTSAITRPLDYANPALLSLQSMQYNALDAISSSVVQGSGEVLTPTVPQTTTYGYDHDLNATNVQVVQGGLVTATTFITNSFDLADRLITSSYTALPADVSAGQTLGYDPADNPTDGMDFNLYRRSGSFDGANQLSQQLDSCVAPGCMAPAITTSSSYDPNGNLVGLVQQTAGLGQTGAYTATYNPADWPSSQDDSQDDGAGATTYGYDAAGRVRSISSQGGYLVVTRTVDAASRVTLQGDIVTDTVPAPELGMPTATPTATASPTPSCGGLTSTTPTAVGTATTLVTSTSESCFTYNQDDQPLTTTLANGAQELRSYDGAARLAYLNAVTPLTISSSAYWNEYWVAQRNPLGSLTAITTGYICCASVAGSTTDTYGYNALGQLGSASSVEAGLTYQWSYDSLGNLSQETTGANLPHVFTYGQAAGLSHQLLQAQLAVVGSFS